MGFHKIKHSFREEVIIPYVAITDNIDFLLSDEPKKILTDDGVLCNVVERKERHICTLADEIRRIYGIEPWNFLCKWYGAFNSMDSQTFVCLKLQKIDVQEKQNTKV